MKEYDFPSPIHKRLHDIISPRIVSLYENHPYKDVMKKRIKIAYILVSPNAPGDLHVVNYLKMLNGLASKKLPEILAKCKNAIHAEMVLDFAATIAYWADSKIPTRYAAQAAHAYLENNNQTEIDACFSNLNTWFGKNPINFFSTDFIELFVELYLTEKQDVC